MSQAEGDRSKIKRKPRMPREVVRERALAAGERMMLHEGLMASMDHLNLEEVIAQAEVPRSAVHRLWPSKSGFIADLLKRLASRAESSPAVFAPRTLAVAVDAMRDNLGRLSSEKGRLATFVEVCRRGALTNFEANLERQSWHLLVVLAATSMSFEDDLRIELQRSMASSERAYARGMAQFYAAAFEVIGRRVRLDLTREGGGHIDHDFIAEVCSSAMQGQVLRSALNGPGDLMPALRELTDEVDPFSTGDARPWSGPAITFTASMLAMTEPNPNFIFNHGDCERQINLITEQAKRSSGSH